MADGDLGNDMTLGAAQPATARMLVQQQRCFVMCLFAVDNEAESCTCSRCDGEYHGALAFLLDQPIPDAPRRTTTQLPGESPDCLFDVLLPEPAGAAS